MNIVEKMEPDSSSSFGQMVENELRRGLMNEQERSRNNHPFRNISIFGRYYGGYFELFYRII